jgi:hypothetical protein
VIEGGFSPTWDGYGTDVTTFANEIDHSPVSLAHLDFIQLQAHKFRPAKTTAKQHRQHCNIPLRSHTVAACVP